jgi:hypothetical protein
MNHAGSHQQAGFRGVQRCNPSSPSPQTPRPGTPAPHTVRSNFLSVKDDMQHLEWLKKAKEDQNITPTIFENITWKNANRVLGLNLS